MENVPRYMILMVLSVDKNDRKDLYEQFVRNYPDMDPNMVLEDIQVVFVTTIQQLSRYLLCIVQKSVLSVFVFDTVSTNIFVYKIHKDKAFFCNYYLPIVVQEYPLFTGYDQIYYRTK